MSTETEMQLAPTDSDETRSNAGSDVSDNASDTEYEVFVPKEPEDSEWHAEYPAEWPKVNMGKLEIKLSEHKKAHKNALPNEEELVKLAFDDDDIKKYIDNPDVPSTQKQTNIALLYKILLGTKNADGKLTEAGKKDSMRAKWKVQFPKTKRPPEAIGFKIFADEAFQTVEEVYIPAFQNYVNVLDEKAKDIDKGNQPAVLKQAKDQLQRAMDSQAARKVRVDAHMEAQKKRREAKVAKERAKSAKAKPAKDTNGSVVEVFDPNLADLNRRWMDLVKDLQLNQSMDVKKAFEVADAEFQKWLDDLKVGKSHLIEI